MWRIDRENSLTHLDGPEKTVWVPSEQLVFHHVDLPAKSKQLWGQMVSFALEEKLLDSVERMHLTIGENVEEAGAIVVSLPLELMNEWMQLLKRNKIKANKVYPDFLAIPNDGSAAQAVLWCENGNCSLRIGAQQNFTGSADWLHAIARVRNLSDIRVFSDESVELPSEWHVRAESLPRSLDMLLQEAAVQPQPINLLQGSFRPAPLFVEFLKPWYWSGVALVLLFALFLGEMQVKKDTLEQQTINIRKASELTFLAYFPGNAVAAQNIRGYLTGILANLEEGASAQRKSAWKIMLALDPLIKACPACRVERIKMTRNKLDIEVSSSQDIAQLVEGIRALPNIVLNAEPLKASKERSKSRLTLEFQESQS